jgi:hypothetical protein
MAIDQWKRAKFIVEQMKEADRTGADIVVSRSEIKRMAEVKFKWCHDCLLLAVYGMYKNGFIKDTTRAKAKQIDFVGFDGRDSANIHHAFDALELLKKNINLNGIELKRQLGGEQSIYSFVVYYFKNDLLSW